MFKTKSLNETVAERIAKSGDKVLEVIANARYEKEFKRRSDAATKVVDNLFVLEGNLKKIRPDHVSYTVVEGKRVEHASWSKAKLDERDKLEQQIAQHETALTKAFEEDDWEKLFNLANGKPVGEVKEDDQS